MDDADVGQRVGDVGKYPEVAEGLPGAGLAEWSDGLVGQVLQRLVQGVVQVS